LLTRAIGLTLGQLHRCHWHLGCAERREDSTEIYICFCFHILLDPVAIYKLAVKDRRPSEAVAMFQRRGLYLLFGSLDVYTRLLTTPRVWQSGAGG